MINLYGTPKQINFARDIRNKIITSIDIAEVYITEEMSFNKEIMYKNYFYVVMEFARPKRSDFDQDWTGTREHISALQNYDKLSPDQVVQCAKNIIATKASASWYIENVKDIIKKSKIF